MPWCLWLLLFDLLARFGIQSSRSSICALECALAGAVLFQLMVMVTGVEWLIEPDVPFTANVT